MKKLFFFLFLVIFSMQTEAQKFIRYHMSDSTYNGFYTSSIESVIHDFKDGRAKSFIRISGKTFEIPVNNIEYISFESANVEDGNIGDYRLYELEYDNKDVKRIFVDNRASLFASRNGDFGANDTILFSSAYNDIRLLFFTDNEGRIKKIFDSHKLLYFDYNCDEGYIIVDLSDGSYSQIVNSRINERSLRRQGAFNNFFFRQIDRLPDNIASTKSSLSELSHNINEITNNPELHNQLLILDGVAVLGDAIAIGVSIGRLIGTDGLDVGSWVSLGNNVANLINNTLDLINDISPSLEQIRAYKEYYERRYLITVIANPAENVSYTSATLCGRVTSLEGPSGTFSFSLFGEEDRVLSGTRHSIVNNSCRVTADARELEPGSPYFYSVEYTCIVDGLRLVFTSDDIAEFTTQCPAVYTGEVHSKSSDRAEVICRFYDVPKDALCGVEYSWSEGKEKIESNTTRNGEQYFSLYPLIPNTTYTYKAYVKIDDYYIYADESVSFTTDNEEDEDPVAITGSYYNVSTTTASIEFTYENVPELADCGYYISKSIYSDASRRRTISGGVEWNQVSFGTYEGTKTIELSDLMPDEKYEYYAYISVDNEVVATGEKNSFSTLRPSAFLIGDAKVDGNTATIEYGFRNVPEGGRCLLVLLKVGDALDNAMYIPIPNSVRGEYTIPDLEKSASYQYFVRIEFNERKWDSADTGSFTTESDKPTATTGDYSELTARSVVVSGIFENIPDGAVCGVEYMANNVKKEILSENNQEGEISFSINGLEPNTTYSYIAFIKVGKEYIYAKERKQFTTESVANIDFSGIWRIEYGISSFYLKLVSEYVPGDLINHGRCIYSPNLENLSNSNYKQRRDFEFEWESWGDEIRVIFWYALSNGTTRSEVFHGNGNASTVKGYVYTYHDDYYDYWEYYYLNRQPNYSFTMTKQ